MTEFSFRKMGKELVLMLLLATLLFGSNALAGNDQWDDGFENFNRRNFNRRSIIIDNEWWPLTPGKQMTFIGSTIDNGEEIPHKVIFTVTDLIKRINGVYTVVIWEQDFSGEPGGEADELEESELAFFAQDKKGNVWHFGQYREMYEVNDAGDSELLGGRAWLVGHLKGARAGIMMQANPEMTTSDYSQGFAPAPFYWTDRARVSAIGLEITVPTGTYDEVIEIEEYNEEEPGAVQLKYYAKGIGNVAVGFEPGDPTQEILQLVEIKTLTGAALKKARKNALELESRNYIYGRTFPAVKRRCKPIVKDE